MLPPKILWYSFLTIVRKETTRTFRIWQQTLLSPLMTQVLYFVIFGGFVGSRVGEMDGVRYMAFVVPGLVLMAVIQNSYMHVVMGFFSMKFMKSIEEIMVSPTPNWVTMVGFSAGGVIRGVLVGALVFLTSVYFARPSIEHPFIILLFLFLTATLFSFAGFFNAIFAKKFDDTMFVTSFVLTPLTYLGGVFYSINQLPPFWQKISMLNPIHYMVDGFRYGFFGTASSPVWLSALVIACVTAGFAFANLYFLKKGTGMRN